MLLSEQYQLIYPEMNRSTWQQIVLYAVSWVLFLVLLWTSFGRQLLIRVLQPLGINTTDKYLDKKFWLDASDRLMYEGKAPQFSDTQAARMPAFFEHANTNLPQYA